MQIPLKPLVLKTGLTAGKAENANNAGYIGFKYQGDGSVSNLLTLGLFANDNILNITGGGNVGIGTTVPSASLHVYRAGSGDGHSVIESEYGADGGRWTKAWLNRKDTYENWYGLYISSS